MDFQDNILPTLVPLLLALIVFFLVIEWFIDQRLEKIATYLTLAERDLNSNLSSGLEHGGRKDVVSQRREWVQGYPVFQVSGLGHRTVAEEMVFLNEADRASKAAAMGRASITAFLLRELYEGNVVAAQSKIRTEVINTGKPPYIAPGIYELVGYDKFDAKSGEFALDAGVNPRLLKRVVREMRYPREIQFVKIDAKGTRFRLTGKDVLTELTEQKV